MSGLRIAFVSTMEADPWGGCEELWAGAAQRLAAHGHNVMASVRGWSPLHQRVAELSTSGVRLHVRPAETPIWLLGWRKLRRVERSRLFWTSDIADALAAFKPDLVVVSEGGTLPPPELVEHLQHNYRYALVMHLGYEAWWPDDALASKSRAGLAAAERVFFVSERNRKLCETQLGCDLDNAEIVRNPCNVSRAAEPPWPEQNAQHELSIAIVGRLVPALKGHDLLFEALSEQRWRERNWRLQIYGDGLSRNTLAMQVKRLGLDGKIEFCGHTQRVEDIWARNHLLAQPSRAEGLPLTVVEAMMCGRAIVATDVAGHTEVIDEGQTGFIASAPTAACIGDALERAWQRRGDLRQMGQAAAVRIRRMMPDDPAAVFADRLLELGQAKLQDVPRAS